MSLHQYKRESTWRVLGALIDFYQEHGRAPSYEGLAMLSGLKAREEITDKVRFLKKNGYLEWDTTPSGKVKRYSLRPLKHQDGTPYA